MNKLLTSKWTNVVSLILSLIFMLYFIINPSTWNLFTFCIWVMIAFLNFQTLMEKLRMKKGNKIKY